MLNAASSTRSRLRDRMRSDGGFRRRVIGATLAVVVIVGVFVAATKPNPFASPMTVRAVFDEAIGLAPVSRDVRVGGVNVGRIGSVEQSGDDAEIEMLIDEDIGGVYRDARASLRPHHPFEGTAFIDLDPGSPSAGPLGDDVIGVEHTRIYVSLDQAVRVLELPAREALKTTVAELATTLGDPRARAGLGRTFDNAPRLTRQLAEGARAAQGPHGNELSGAIRGLSETVGALGDQRDDLLPLVEGARRTLAAVDVDRGGPLDRTLAELPPTLAEVDSGSRSLRSLLLKLDPLAVDLRPALRELTPTLREARPFARHLGPTLGRAQPLLDALRPALRRTIAAVPELRGLLSELGPNIALVRNGVVPALNSETRLGLPAYLQFTASGKGLTGALRSFEVPGQNPLGSGHMVQLQGKLAALGTGVLPACASFGGLNPDFAELAREVDACTP